MRPLLVVAASFAYTCCCSRWRTGPTGVRDGRSVIGNAWVYALLSMGVYCTAWTYFGSIGRGRLRAVVPADLPRADAGDAAGWLGAAQDDPHRAALPHHLDRRLHRQPLRQEPALAGW